MNPSRSDRHAPDRHAPDRHAPDPPATPGQRLSPQRLQWSLALAAGATAVLAGAARLITEGALRAPLHPGRIAVTVAALTVGVALASLAVSAAWPVPRSRQVTRHPPGRSPAPRGPRATPRAAASRASDPAPW